MKKIISIALVLCILLATCLLVSCGGEDGSTTTTTTTTTAKPSAPVEPMNFYEMDLSPYITLGKYKNFTIEVEKLEITDADVKEEIDAYLETQATYEKLKEGTITEGVKFSIDYAGYTDGIQFNGGTASDTVAYIKDGEFYTASGSKFIDGFADALLGASVGDKIDVVTAFPSDYHSAELAGKDVVFKCTVNYICGDTVVPDYTDDWVAEFTNGQYKTTADFNAYLKAYLQDAIDSARSAEVWNLVMSNATYTEIPEQQYSYYYDYYKSYLESYAQYYGMTYEQFLSAGYANYIFGIDVKSDAELQEMCTTIVKEELAIFALMKAENLTITDEEYDKFIADLVAESGKSKEEIEKLYSRDDIIVQMLISEVQQIVFDINTFVEKIPENK